MRFVHDLHPAIIAVLTIGAWLAIGALLVWPLQRLGYKRAWRIVFVWPCVVGPLIVVVPLVVVAYPFVWWGERHARTVTRRRGWGDWGRR